jgi:hypothetical protein
MEEKDKIARFNIVLATYVLFISGSVIWISSNVFDGENKRLLGVISGCLFFLGSVSFLTVHIISGYEYGI